MLPSPLNDDARTRVAELYQRHAVAVTDRLLARYRSADPQLVADAVVEALLRVAASGEHSAPNGHLRIARIARDRLRSKFRTDTRRKAREENYATDFVTEQGSGGPSTDDAASDREAATRFRDQIVSNHEEEIVLNAWLDGHTNPHEIAPRTGLASHTVKTILARIRKRISRLRNDERGDES